MERGIGDSNTGIGERYKYLITIFTPTYNRAYIIGNLYESLKCQTSMDFEWIVINDGSTDETSSLFKKWCGEDNGFQIIYDEVPNGGKHRAINRAVQMAGSDAFFIVDSDDRLLPFAVEKVTGWFSMIADDPEFAGVSGLRGYTIDDPVGGYGNYDGDYVDATNLERGQYGLLNDKAEVYKTEILKKFPFPEFEGENFITESAIWQQIAAAGYKLRWFNEVIYLCDYLEDGLTRNANERIISNPMGYAYYLAVLDTVRDPEEVNVARLNFYKALLSVYDETKAFRIINAANNMKIG